MRFIVKTSNRTAIAEIYWHVCREIEAIKNKPEGWARQYVGYADPCLGDTLFAYQTRDGSNISDGDFRWGMEYACEQAQVAGFDLDEHERAVAQEVAHA